MADANENVVPPLPMMRKWTLYAHMSDGEYADALVALGAFDDFGMLFRYHHHVPPPGRVFCGREACAVHGRRVEGYGVFREGVQPAWEDPSNAGGGSITARQALSSTQLDAVWLPLCMSLCNEEFGDATGIRIVHKLDRRAGLTHKVEVWLPNSPVAKIETVRATLVSEFPFLAFQWTPHRTEQHSDRLTGRGRCGGREGGRRTATGGGRDATGGGAPRR